MPSELKLPVDVFHAATARDHDANQVTLSGLLNTLDGIAPPHGCSWC